MVQFIYKYEYIEPFLFWKKAIKNGAKFLWNYVIIAVIKTFKNAPQLIAIFSFLKVDPTTGSISTTDQTLDYETQTSHSLEVFAKSGRNGKQFVCLVKILVQSQDEYPPVFNQDVFTFDVPNNVAPGFFLGSIR